MGNAPSESPSDSLSVDDVFDALADRRRRKLLTCLRDHDGALTITSAAEELAVAYCDTTKYDYPDEEIKRIRASLHHLHAPKLAAHGLIDYDPERGRIELTDDACYLVPYLKLAAKDEMLLS